MFLSCGDSLFDMFIQAAENDPLRVVVDGVAGGSPMNVAVGLSRLGHECAYFTKLSGDVFGTRLQQFLTINSVDTSLCIPTELKTTLAFVDKQADGSANYSFYIDGTADTSMTEDELPASLPDTIRVLHFGSYSTAVGVASDTLKALAKREQDNRLISYDPNLRLMIEPDLDIWRSSFTSFAQAANLIKASDEDIDALVGTATGAKAEELFVADCFNHGAEIVYVTRGAEGASVYTPDGKSASGKSKPVKVMDTVGAGDTFQAATLHWLATEKHINASGNIQGSVDIEASLQFALDAAAVTCSRFGADLPTLADLQ